MRRNLFIAGLFLVLIINFVVDYNIFLHGLSVKNEWLILITNIIDIGLLIGTSAFFFYERQSYHRTQNSLKLTMKHLREVNESLRRVDAERLLQIQKTVHDLKNPLGTIRGFAELLHDEPKNSRSISQMSQTIQRISDDTLELVNSIMSAKSNSKLLKEPMDARACLTDTCRFLGPLAAKKGQKIEVIESGAPAHVLGNQPLLRDVFFNLIGNALKFSPSGSRVQVRSEKIGSELVISIEDEGPGFMEDEFSKICQPGQKLSARPTGGEVSTGFGLYSAKETIESHGGKLEVRNRPEGGAVFTVSLRTI